MGGEGLGESLGDQAGGTLGESLGKLEGGTEGESLGKPEGVLFQVLIIRLPLHLLVSQALCQVLSR